MGKGNKNRETKNYALARTAAQSPYHWLLVGIIVQCKKDYSADDESDDSVKSFMETDTFDYYCSELGLDTSEVKFTIENSDGKGTMDFLS